MEGNGTFGVAHESLPWAEILVIDGELDIAVAGRFAELIEKQLEGSRPVIVDLTACTYLDSTILNVLVRAANAAPERVGVIVPLESRVRKLFKITSLEAPLRLTETRDQLQERFSARADS
ncbi:MAG TPA: STAS domain-containing protein [Candidatus Baltobacteraceae bacterium]|nr:STAS domain-containing protein [Candidatus Baltobacteraceae bacterium]